MSMKLHTAHIHSQYITKLTFAAHWIDEFHTCEYLVPDARDNLVKLLASEPAGTNSAACREALIDLIAAAIVDSNDIDATPESQAEAIIEDILNNCLPMPTEDAS
jgi:hypothetical protein